MEPNRKPEALGVGLRLEDGDLAFGGRDLATVAGRENLLQGLAVMIGTPFGSDSINVHYGFDLESAIVPANQRPLVKELIRLNVVKSLSLDDRVQEVREVVFDDVPRFFELVPEADPEDARRRRRVERRWRLAVVLATITEGEVVLDLQGAGV